MDSEYLRRSSIPQFSVPELLEPQAGDHLIANLAKVCNAGDEEFAVTLSVANGFISGFLTSGLKFIKATALQIIKDPNSEHGIWLGEKLGPMFESYTKNVGLIDRSNIWYIHMRDAHFFVAGSEPSLQRTGVWWRGRIDSVIGFSFGLVPSAGETDGQNPIGFNRPVEGS